MILAADCTHYLQCLLIRVAPSTEALVIWVVAGKVAVADESSLLVSASSESDLLVLAHLIGVKDREKVDIRR